jgi:hypothetical protein
MRYVIFLDTVFVESYYKTYINPLHYRLPEDEEVRLVLDIDEEDLTNKKFFITQSNHFVIEGNFKIEFEKYFRDFEVEKIKIVLSKNYNDKDYYKVNFNSFSMVDFYYYKNTLILSKKALDYFKAQGIFKENFIGTINDKEYNIYLNLVEYEGTDMRHFINNELPIKLKEIQKVREEIW